MLFAIAEIAIFLSLRSQSQRSHRSLSIRFPYNRSDHCVRCAAIVAIIWKPGLRPQLNENEEISTRGPKDKNLLSFVRFNRQEERMCELEGRVCNGSYTWRIENYQQHRQAAINGIATCILSPPFYTSLSGYKLCLRVNLNGVDSGVGKYIAMFVHMMQGDYDNSLAWPFTGKITLTILNQSEGSESRQHISESLIAEPNHLASQRPTAPLNHEGYGCVAIAPIEHIREPQYISNNTMLVRIQIDI